MDQRFHRAWLKLSEEGQCDSPGGMEFKRVYAEWVAAHSPMPIEDFIVERANANSEGKGPKQVEAEKKKK